MREYSPNPETLKPCIYNRVIYRVFRKYSRVWPDKPQKSGVLITIKIQINEEKDNHI